MSDLRLKSRWSEVQDAQCEGAVKIHNTLSPFLAQGHGCPLPNWGEGNVPWWS